VSSEPVPVAVVTGAAGGLGRVLVARLETAGYAVVAANRTDADLSDAAVTGDDVRNERLDGGGIDLLVNNAARQPVAAYLDIDAAAWDDIADTNVRAAHLLTRAVAATMIERGSAGCVVNIGSIEGLQPAPGHSHYAVSKAGLEMLTRAAALELGAYGIRVNLVAPGLIDDGAIEARWPEGVARWRAAAPLPGLVGADEVADAVVFLASPAARGVTGATLVVDHGVLARPTW
jgi:glucose 1-dehydrogenase